MHLVKCCKKEGRSTLYKHVFVPLIGWRVEEAPAGCILGCHHTPVQTAQHGHHIVLDSTCNRKVLKEFGSAEKTTQLQLLYPNCKMYLFIMYLFLKMWAYLCFMYQKIVAQPNPVATLRWESGLGREVRKSLLQRPSCQVISWLVSLAVKESLLDQTQPGWCKRQSTECLQL